MTETDSFVSYFEIRLRNKTKECY